MNKNSCSTSPSPSARVRQSHREAAAVLYHIDYRFYHRFLLAARFAFSYLYHRHLHHSDGLWGKKPTSKRRLSNTFGCKKRGSGQKREGGEKKMPTELTQHQGNVRMHREEARRRWERVPSVSLQSLKTVTSNKPQRGGRGAGRGAIWGGE